MVVADAEAGTGVDAVAVGLADASGVVTGGADTAVAAGPGGVGFTCVDGDVIGGTGAAVAAGAGWRTCADGGGLGDACAAVAAGADADGRAGSETGTFAVAMPSRSKSCLRAYEASWVHLYKHPKLAQLCDDVCACNNAPMK